VRAGYQSIQVTIRISSNASPDQLEKLRAEIEARCPVSDNIAHPTPVSIALSLC
jgi:uncharacterized OsmC-like protein